MFELVRRLMTVCVGGGGCDMCFGVPWCVCVPRHRTGVYSSNNKCRDICCLLSLLFISVCPARGGVNTLIMSDPVDDYRRERGLWGGGSCRYFCLAIVLWDS